MYGIRGNTLSVEYRHGWRSYCCQYPVQVTLYAAQCLKCQKTTDAHNIYPALDQYSELIELMEP